MYDAALPVPRWRSSVKFESDIDVAPVARSRSCCEIQSSYASRSPIFHHVVAAQLQQQVVVLILPHGITLNIDAVSENLVPVPVGSRDE